MKLWKGLCILIFIGFVGGGGGSRSFWSCGNVWASGFDPESIGDPGPHAINLEVWTDRDYDESVREGEQLIIYLEADRKAYLAILVVAASGDVWVIFPNNELANTVIEKDRVYTLFGDDSQIWVHLVKQHIETKLAFYVSDKPFDFTPLQPDDGRSCIAIPAFSGEQMQLLTQKLSQGAKSKRFNRVILSFKRKKDQGFNISTKKAVAPKRLYKKIPGGRESEPPEILLGTQGVKDELIRASNMPGASGK